MKNTLKNYKITILISTIYLIVFVIDMFLRIMNGATFGELFTIKSFGQGTYAYLWFKSSLFFLGEIWRVFTWSLTPKGILEFIINIMVLVVLVSQVEKRIGSKKTLLSYIALNVIVLLAMYLTYCDLSGNIFLDFGMAGTNVMLFTLSGLLFTLIFVNNDSILSKRNIKLFVVLVYIVYQFIYVTVIGMGQYVIFYAYSWGMLLALCYVFSNQKSITKNSGKINIKKYPFILSTFFISMLIFILNSIMINSDILIELYGESNLNNWFSYFISGGDYGLVARKLLCNMNKVRTGEVWRLFTHPYSHMGLIHMATNMPVLLFTGKYVEKELGTKKTMIIYLGSAFFVGVVALIEGSQTTTMGGSSLSIYALIAAYLLLAFKNNTNIKSKPYEVIYIIIYFILGNVPSIGTFGEAHLMSYMYGIVVIFLYNSKFRIRNV